MSADRDRRAIAKLDTARRAMSDASREFGNDHPAYDMLRKLVEMSYDVERAIEDWTRAHR